MGSPKAALEWHGSTLLYRTVSLLSRSVTGPLIVVRAAGQPLPDLPAGTTVLDDPAEGLGPIQGLAVGLDAAGASAELAFVCSTDLPFLHPAFVDTVLGAVADDVDVALPVARGFPQPLAAAYRTRLAAIAEQLLAAGRRRPAFLFEECRTLRLDDQALLADPRVAALDPSLDSLLNLNEPDDYRHARQRPAPRITIECFGALATRTGIRVRSARAATLAQAARSVALTLDRHVLAAVNGEQISRDRHLPLAFGDRVSFISADAGG